MRAHSRFRLLLTGIATAVAVVFLAVGLWERNHILSQPFFNGSTLSETTARFHVWPWSFKLAVIWDTPALIGSSILMLPIRLVWTTLPEAADLVPAGVLTTLLWYRVASRLEPYPLRARWLSLVSFGVLSLTGALIPIGHTGFLPFGLLLWCVVALLLRRSRVHFKQNPSQLT